MLELQGYVHFTGFRSPSTTIGFRILKTASFKLSNIHALDSSSPFGAVLGEHAAPLDRGYTALVKIYLFQEATAALGHARQRIFSNMHRHTCLLAQPLVEMPEQGSATCEDHPPVHDIRA